jgi:hypothetical protein
MDLDPLRWLGGAAAAATGEAWKSAMIALWSAGLWVLKLAFQVIDAFTTPDLSAGGPLVKVLPYTFYLGAVVALLMAMVQIGAAAWRRDGQSLGRVLVGVAQFALVWSGYVGCAVLLVTATAGLTKGLLSALLGVEVFAGFDEAVSWPRHVDDTVVATVLGLCTVFLIFPAAIGWLLIMLVREAALMVLTATAPIAAAGLLGESTRVWWWKSLRWFIAALLISPLSALVLGVGVQILHGIVKGSGDDTAAAVGMAVTGSVLMLISAVCPLILFRLLAFVDPGTSSGATMRQSWTAAGGMSGLLGRGDAAGSGAAVQQDEQGRAQGEGHADAQTQGRIVAAVQQLTARAGAVGTRAASIGADVTALSGVGHQAPYYEQTAGGGAAPGGRTGAGRGPDDGAGPPPADGPEGAPTPPPIPPPPPVDPPSPTRRPGGGAPPSSGGGGGAAAGGGGGGGAGGTGGAAGGAGGGAAGTAAGAAAVAL